MLRLLLAGLLVMRVVLVWRGGVLVWRGGVLVRLGVLVWCVLVRRMVLRILVVLRSKLLNLVLQVQPCDREEGQRSASSHQIYPSAEHSKWV